MKTFQKHLQEIYGTEDEMHYIVPRLSDNDLLQAVHNYAREAIKEHLSRAAENAGVIWYNDYPYGKVFERIDKESITNIDIELP